MATTLHQLGGGVEEGASSALTGIFQMLHALPDVTGSVSFLPSLAWLMKRLTPWRDKQCRAGHGAV